MKTIHTLSITLSATVLCFALSIEASAEDAAADATITVDADAGMPDAATDADALSPPPPRFDEAPFPSEKSPMPKDAEWKTAPFVSLAEGYERPGCKAQRIREWMRLECETEVAKVTLLGGNAEGVRFRLAPLEEEWQRFPSRGEMIFPVRRGDRRVIEWQGVEWGYKGAMTARSEFLISELWLEDEEKPILLFR